MHIDLNEKGGEAYNTNEAGETARSTFTMAGKDLMIIDHTEIPDSMRGQQIGFRLVKKLVEFARQNGIKIIPLCPFAKSVFEKNDQFSDVLRK